MSLKKPTYTILYPTGGYVLIPKNLNLAPQIIIGNLQDDQQLKKYLSLYKQTKSTSSTTELQRLKTQMDSLQSLMLQLHYSENELTNAREMQEKRDDYLPEINTSLTDYYIYAIDLKTAFKYVSEYAFDNGAALEQLASAVRNYNAAFKKLNDQHVNYEKRIGDYWQNDSLKAAFTRLSSFALDTIHRQKIYIMQGTIAEIRKYFNAGVKVPELRKSIQQNIGRLVSELELLLPRLEDESKGLIQELNI